MLDPSTRTSHLSLAHKTFFALCLLIMGLSLLYYTTSSMKSSKGVKEIVVVHKVPVVNNSNECKLSMNESDDWFCESDTSWKRRKSLDRIQHKRNRASDARQLYFQNNWEPTLQCEFERRLGNIGDGGKWVCDIHRYLQADNKTKLLIYSLGSNGDFSFENAIKEQLPDADIHTFDMGLYMCPPNVCTFHQARLGDGKNDSSKTLPMIMKELGHQNRQIHILKIDIEGSEYNFFEDFFNPSSNKNETVPYIRQILVEIHLNRDPTAEPTVHTHKFFELFRSNHYVIFHKEVNLYDPQNVFEYAFLRLNPVFFVTSV